MRAAQLYQEDEIVSSDAELSLGIGSLIGIFFGLALVCGVFFGFGYTMGHRAPAARLAPQTLTNSPASSVVAVAPKPSAQVPEQPADASRVIVSATASTLTPAPESDSADSEGATKMPTAITAKAAKAKPAVQQASNTSSARRPAVSIPAPAMAQSGTMMVQIAAVKSRADADALAAALRKNGFTPSVRSDSQDKLLHVQLGPFESRDEAKAMRQKLSGAGYNAFIK
jgi:DedD protein